MEIYNITLREFKGDLKFIVKLDKCEIVKEKKIESMTITLMNRALDPSITKTSSKYFSILSEKHVWWLGSFEVWIFLFWC